MTDFPAGQSADEHTIHFLQSVRWPLCPRPGHFPMPARGKQGCYELELDGGSGGSVLFKAEIYRQRWYSLECSFGVLTTVKCIIKFIWGICVSCVWAEMPDRLCFELRCVLCQPVKKMGIQPTKYPLGILLFFPCSCTLCVQTEVWMWGSTWERAGVPGHWAFNSKIFQRLSTSSLMTSADRAWILAFPHCRHQKP